MAGDRTMLMFGDSSGNPSRTIGGFSDSPYYTVVTITMGANEAHRIDGAVHGIKRRWLPSADPLRVEFHGSALRRTLNRYAGNREHADMMFHGILDDLVGVIRDSEAVVNVVIMDKVAPDEAAKDTNVMVRTWSHAADMFRQNILHAKSDTVGIAILDRYDDAANRVVSGCMAHSLLQLEAPGLGTNSKAIPHPIFVDSRSSNAVQLVDIATYIEARRIAGSKGGEFEDWHRRLLPSVGRTINIKPKLDSGSGGPA